jgi:predicted DNA-binding transcriptional regulator YafY
MSRQWTTYERRAEIMRILEGRRQETMSNLASQLGVSIRTIAYDITALMAEYPLETVRGKDGCVRLTMDCGTYQNNLSQEQQELLLELLPALDERKAQRMRELLRAHGSRRNKDRIGGNT